MQVETRFIESRLRFIIWASIFCVAVFDVVGLMKANIAFHPDQEVLWLVFSVFITYPLGAFFLRRIGNMAQRKWSFALLKNICHSMIGLLEGVAQFNAFLVVYLIFSYVAVAASAPFPYHDAFLLAADQSIGFHWQAWVAWVEQHPVIGQLLFYAYHSFVVQLCIAFFVLVLTERFICVQRMILAFIISAAICTTIAMLFPSAGIISYLALDTANLHWPREMGYQHLADVESLRHGAYTAMSFKDLKGLITFPSFHASFSVIILWGVWQVRWLRGLAIPLNIAMVISTLVIGGHYMVDVIVGFMVAALVIRLIKRIEYSYEHVAQ